MEKNKRYFIITLIILFIALMIISYMYFGVNGKLKKYSDPGYIQGTFMVGNELADPEYIVVDQQRNVCRYHQNATTEQGTIRLLDNSNIYIITFGEESRYVIYYVDYINVLNGDNVVNAKRISDIPLFINATGN